MNRKTTANRNARKNTQNTAAFETLEGRQMYSASPVHAPKLVGYLPDYSYAATIDKINWSSINQLNFFSVGVDASGKLAATGNSTSGYDLAGQLNDAVSKAHAHGLKVDIVVGGAGKDGSDPTVSEKNRPLLSEEIRSAMTTSTGRRAIASSVRDFVATYHVDGVDLDWEPSEVTTTDLANYGKLIQQIRSTNPSIDIAAAVNPEPLGIVDNNGQAVFNVNGNQSTAYVLNSTAIKNLNNIGVMDYDLDAQVTSGWDRSTADLNAWAQYADASGGSRSEVLMGLPFYGSYSPTANDWADSVQNSYSNIINNQLANGGTIDATSDNSEGWAFNGQQTVADKTSYALETRVGGVMVWDLGQDTYSDTGTNQYSLMPAIAKSAQAWQNSPSYTDEAQTALATHHAAYSPFSSTAIDFQEGDSVDQMLGL